MAQQEFKLTQTKSSFKFQGIVEGLSNENAYREGTIGQGRSEGKEYRSVAFRVKTSENNALRVELFGMEQDYVYPYKQGKKDAKTGKRSKGDSKKIAFEDRHDLPEGYHLIGVSVSLEKDSKGKAIRQNLVEYDAVDAIFNNLEDGDSVYVNGEIQFSMWDNDRTGETELQTKYIIKGIGRTKKPIDFQAEDFEELNSFDQEIVFTGADVDKASKSVIVSAYTIQYGDKFTPCTFYIRPEGDKDIEKIAAVFSKKIKFGDFVKVVGLAFNKSEEVEVEVKAEKAKASKDDPFGDAVGKKAKGYDKTTITHYTQELQVIGIEQGTFIKERYTEADFVVEELVDEDEDDGSDPFFASSEEDEDNEDISDDDLPF